MGASGSAGMMGGTLRCASGIRLWFGGLGVVGIASTSLGKSMSLFGIAGRTMGL